MLAPEQTRALAYIERKSGASGDRLREIAASSFERLEALIAPIPEEIARRRPARDRWSVLEVVDHLVESNRPAVAQLANLLAGRSPSEAIPAGLQSAERETRSWAEHRTALAEVHRELLDCLAGAGDGARSDSRAPVVMVVKVETDGILRPEHWIEHFDWKAYTVVLHLHALEHLHQIERTLTEVTEPEPPAGTTP